MKTLSHPDRHHLDAATGWLMLDNPLEARTEADKISTLGRLAPEAIVIRWQIHARLKEWEKAHSVAEIFTRVCPAQAASWLCLSYTLYRMKRSEDAWHVLLPKAGMFPKVRAIPYLLACYAAQNGQHAIAEAWLERSAALGGPSKIQTGHLERADLGIGQESAAAERAPADPVTGSRLVGSWTP
jgi:hypothetical protein